jgi:plasmid stabilization system protein ParE
MTATVEFSDDARRMLDDADERWVAEHGYLAANPLVEEAEHATELLRHNPELACDSVELGAAGLRSGACCFKQAGTSTTYSVDVSRSHVLILAVWYASRGGPPPL